MLDAKYFNRIVTEVAPTQSVNATGDVSLVQGNLLSIHLVGGGHIYIGPDSGRMLAAEIMAAADEADAETRARYLRAGIEAGDLDHNGDEVPYHMYRRA